MNIEIKVNDGDQIFTMSKAYRQERTDRITLIVRYDMENDRSVLQLLQNKIPLHTGFFVTTRSLSTEYAKYLRIRNYDLVLKFYHKYNNQGTIKN